DRSNLRSWPRSSRPHRSTPLAPTLVIPSVRPSQIHRSSDRPKGWLRTCEHSYLSPSVRSKRVADEETSLSPTLQSRPRTNTFKAIADVLALVASCAVLTGTKALLLALDHSGIVVATGLRGYCRGPRRSSHRR